MGNASTSRLKRRNPMLTAQVFIVRTSRVWTVSSIKSGLTPTYGKSMMDTTRVKNIPGIHY